MAGTEWLTSEVASVIASCPSTNIILSGYSQGAQVTGDTYQSHLTDAQRQHVLGMVLYGDTYFNGSSWAARGSFDANRNGILGRRDDYPSKMEILSGYEDLGALGIGMSPAGGLDIAELYDALGRHEDARRTLERYVEGPVLKSHSVYPRPYLVRRGHDDLVELIRTR